jgi:hypothetical protein
LELATDEKLRMRFKCLVSPKWSRSRKRDKIVQISAIGSGTHAEFFGVLVLAIDPKGRRLVDSHSISQSIDGRSG